MRKIDYQERYTTFLSESYRSRSISAILITLMLQARSVDSFLSELFSPIEGFLLWVEKN